jgi:hypothetical protein
MATLMGGMLSGSRTAFFGSLVMGCILVGPVIAGRIRVRPLALSGQMLLVLGFLGVGYQSLVIMPESETQFRATSTESFLDRITGYYLSQGLENAYAEGGAMGDGWGPLTNGAASYAGVIGGREFRKFDNQGLVSNWQAHYIEGGYSCTLYAVGYVGLALFLAGHASFLATQLDWQWLSFGLALGAWSIIGNLPFALQEIGVLTILWWLLAGVFWAKCRATAKANGLERAHVPARRPHARVRAVAPSPTERRSGPRRCKA